MCFFFAIKFFSLEETVEHFFGVKAAVRPSRAKVLRVLSMVDWEVSTASFMSLSAYAGPNPPSSAFNRMRARVSLRADSVPVKIRPMRDSCCSLSRRTGYRFAGIIETPSEKMNVLESQDTIFSIYCQNNVDIALHSTFFLMPLCSPRVRVS